MSKGYTTQNELLLKNLLSYYNKNNYENLTKILSIINGESVLSIRIIDWFVTNYAKKNYIVYSIPVNNIPENEDIDNNTQKKALVKRFKVYIDYKLKLKAYSKRRFDPFCRWERINIPYRNNTYIQTTLGQLNFFKWALENRILDHIQNHISDIEKDMNNRNTTSRKKNDGQSINDSKTRKKREELSISAVKSIKKEEVEIIVRFD
jgi:hypothetical protein